jgi:hypothetical protein
MEVAVVPLGRAATVAAARAVVVVAHYVVSVASAGDAVWVRDLAADDDVGTSNSGGTTSNHWHTGAIDGRPPLLRTDDAVVGVFAGGSAVPMPVFVVHVSGVVSVFAVPAQSGPWLRQPALDHRLHPPGVGTVTAAHLSLLHNVWVYVFQPAGQHAVSVYVRPRLPASDVAVPLAAAAAAASRVLVVDLPPEITLHLCGEGALAVVPAACPALAIVLRLDQPAVAAAVLWPLGPLPLSKHYDTATVAAATATTMTSSPSAAVAAALPSLSAAALAPFAGAQTQPDAGWLYPAFFASQVLPLLESRVTPRYICFAKRGDDTQHGALTCCFCGQGALGRRVAATGARAA